MAESEHYDSGSDIDATSDISLFAEHEGSDDGDDVVVRSTENIAYLHESQHSRTTSQAIKAIEAAEERNYDDLPDHSSAGPAQSAHDGHTALDDDFPILDAGPAPPDYYAATAWRRSRLTAGGGPPDSNNYSSVQDRSYDFQASYRAYSADETSPLLPRQSQGKGRYSKGRRRCLMSSTAFVLVVILVTSLLVWLRSKEKPTTRSHPSIHGDPWLDHPSTAQCKFSSFSEYIDIPIRDPGYFYFNDAIDFGIESGVPNTLVTGNVEIVYVPRDSRMIVEDAPIVVRMHYATVSGWTLRLVENVTYFSLPDWGLQLRRPVCDLSSGIGRISGDRGKRDSLPCVDVLVLVYIREGTVIKDLDIMLNRLNLIDHAAAVSADEDTEERRGIDSLLVSGQTELYTRESEITTSFRSLSGLYLSTDDGTITGTHEIYANMTIRAARGSVDVLINPVEMHETFNMPDLPVFSPSLLTLIGSSSAKVRIGTERSHRAVESLQSAHWSESGYVSLWYPSLWGGTVYGRAGLGGIDVFGDEVVIDANVTVGSVQTMVAHHHGRDNGFLTLQSLSGSASVYIGDGDGLDW